MDFSKDFISVFPSSFTDASKFAEMFIDEKYKDRINIEGPLFVMGARYVSYGKPYVPGPQPEGLFTWGDYQEDSLRGEQIEILKMMFPDYEEIFDSVIVPKRL